jgi:Polysaccharide deacetylase
MKPHLIPGWYILLYHEVSWEEAPFLRYIGGTCPPDVFRDHVETCATLGALVSIEQGMNRLQRCDFTEPVFSFWFDDGLAGVRRYAAPILAEHGVTGATSVCSRFVARAEMCWRFKLSYLQSSDAGRHLRERLRKFGFQEQDLARHFTLDKFDEGILSIIDQLYEEVTCPFMREDAFRIFDTPEGLLELCQKGWTIANHSAAHYPIGESQVKISLLEQFVECEQFMSDLFKKESKFWVLPFDRKVQLTALDVIRRPPGRQIVLVRNKVNVPLNSEDSGILYRINSPANDRHGLISVLIAASRASEAMRTLPFAEKR